MKKISYFIILIPLLTLSFKGFSQTTITITTPIAGNDTVNIAEAGAVTIAGTSSGTDGTVVRVTIGGVTGDATISGGSWTVDLDITGVADGSLMITAVYDPDGAGTPTASNNITLDQTEPTATVITSDDLVISDSDAGGTVTFTVTFSESMDTGVDPAISFPTENPGGVLVLNSMSSSWNDLTTYNAVYDIFDTDATLANIDVQVNGGQDVSGNGLIAAYTQPDLFSIDTDNPTIFNLSLNPLLINVGNRTLTVTVTYDEQMNNSTMPGIVFTGSMNFTSNMDGTWSTITNTDDTYTETFTHGGTLNETPSVTISGAEDLAGNTDAAGTSGSFMVDTNPPMVDVYTTSIDTISDSDAGGMVTFTIIYTEQMDITVPLTTNFPVRNPGAALVFNNGLSGWDVVMGDRYNAVYGIVDTDITLADIYFEVIGGRDLAGNEVIGSSRVVDFFNIDTENPSATISLSNSSLNLSDLTQTVTVTYTEQMNNSTMPVIGFTSSTDFTSNGAGTWSRTTFTDDTYTETFTHGTTREEIASETVTISGAEDLAGNAGVGGTSGSFIVDTQPPSATVIASTDPVISDSDAAGTVTFTVTFDESMDTRMVVNPVINFPPPVSGLMLNSSSWNGPGDTYTAVFDIVDTNIALEDIDVRVNGGQDARGNRFSTYTQPDLFSIDTENPSFVAATFYDTDTDGSIDEILFEFSEDVQESSFDAADFNIGGAGPGAVPLSVILAATANNGVDGTSGDNYVTLGVTTLNTTVERTIAYMKNGNPIAVSDAVGNRAADDASLMTIDLAAPYSLVNVLETGDLSPDLSGTIDDPDATVFVTVGTSIRAATNNRDGTWTFINTGSAPDGFTLDRLGTYEVTVVGRDVMGNTGADVTNNELTITGGADITAATPANLCTSDDFQPLGSIQITETGQGDFESSGTILLTLPPGFEFNTAAPVTTPGSTFTDITVAFSFIGTTTLQLTITHDGADSGIDVLVINGLEVRTVSGGETGNLERAGGTAILLTSDTNYATLTSNSASGVITSLDETIHTSSDITSFTIRSGLNYTLDATDQTPTTLNWYENIFDGTPEFTGPIATQADLTTSPGLYTYYLANNDGTCDSDPLEFELLIFNDDDPATSAPDSTFINKTYLTVDDADTLYLSNPADHTVNVTGAGTTVTNPDALTLLVIFNPAIAGDNGFGFPPRPHTITYTITNDITGASTSRSVIYTVEPEATIFTGPPPDEYCSDDGVQTLTADYTGFSPSASMMNPYIQSLNVLGQRYRGIDRMLAGDILETGGTYGTGANEYDLNLDLLNIPASEYESVEFTRVVSDISGTIRTDAFNYFIVYGTPSIVLSNVSGTYCEREGSFTINRTTRYVQSVDQSDPENPVATYNEESDQPITNGYMLYRSNDGGITYPISYADFTTTPTNTFDPTDPDQDGMDEVDDVGFFRLVYTTEPLTPDMCIGRDTIDIIINSSTSVPELDATTMSGGGATRFVGADANEYLLEYCAGDMAIDFFTTTDVINTVRWYDENFNPLLGLDGFTSVSPVEVGLNTTPRGGWTEQSDQFYFTSTNATGCESDYRLVSVEVYPIPDVPAVDIASGINYCVAAGSTVTPDRLTLDPLTIEETYNVRINLIVGGFGSSLDSDFRFLTVGNTAGFISGERINSTSGGMGIIYSFSGAEIVLRGTSGTFFPGEMLTGAISSIMTTVTAYVEEKTLLTNGINPVTLPALPLDNIVTFFTGGGGVLGLIPGELLTGQTSGATARLYNVLNDNVFHVRPLTAIPFEAGETVSRASGGPAFTVNNTRRNTDFSSHEYTITKTSSINAASDFQGCTSAPAVIETLGWLVPNDGSLDDLAAGVQDFHVSEGSTLADIAHTDNFHDRYIWYENSDKTGLIDTLPSLGLLTDATLRGVGFNPDMLAVPYTNDLYTYYFSTLDNLNPGRFSGCESDGTFPVNITVHAQQRQPSVVSDNSGSRMSVPDFVDLNGTPPPADGNVDHYYSVCTDQLEADLRLVADEGMYSGNRMFRWYKSDGGRVRGSLVSTVSSLGDSVTFSELQLSSLNPTVTITRYFEVVQVTDIDDYAGVESESTFIRVDISPQDELVVVDNSDVEINASYCRDEDPLGDLSGNLVFALRSGGRQAPALNVDSEIDSYLESTYLAGDPPEVDRLVVPSTLPTVNLMALHDGVPGALAVGGEPTVHVVRMTYSHPVTLCVGNIEKVVTIHPDPDISININGIDIAGFVVGNDQFCYDDATITFRGTQAGGDPLGTGGSAAMQFRVNGTDIATNSSFEAIFNPSVEHPDPYAVQSSYMIEFEYTDPNGCTNSVEQEIFVNPRPEMQEVGSLPSSDLAATNSTNQIRITNVCEDADMVTAEIRMIDPADGAGTLEEDDYSLYIFEWEIEGDPVPDQDMNSLPDPQIGVNTLSFVPPIVINLNISVTVTDLNGCVVTFAEDHDLQELPDLNITGIIDDESFCVDEIDPIVGLTDVAVDGNGDTHTTVDIADIIGWSVDSYSDGDTVQIASGTGSLPAVDLNAWHTDNNIDPRGRLVGGPSTHHQITIVYQDPGRNYQSIPTMCSDTIRETIVVHPDPNISVALNGDNDDDLEFCYDDIDIVLQGIDSVSEEALSLSALTNEIAIDGVIVSSNGRAVIDAATYHGVSPGDEFLPQSRHTIRYTYLDENSCDRTITRQFLVNPRPRFVGDAIQTGRTCVSSDVELFVEMTDGTDNYTYIWSVNGQTVDGINVVDLDGNNTDEQITYNFESRLTVNFGVTATYIGPDYSTSCVSSISQEITVGLEPVPAISWVGITAGHNSGTNFTITEDNGLLRDDDVDMVELVIDGTTELTVSDPRFPINYTHHFTTPGDDHTVTLTMNTVAGCDITLSRKVLIIPHYDITDNYSESFESETSFDLRQGGWLIDSLSLDGKNYYDTATSWTRGTSIPGTAAIDGSGAVYTVHGGMNGYKESEVSFIYSPSFDLSVLPSPTVSFLRYEDFETFRDGVVFQVSVDDGRTWQTVGTYNSSLEDEGLASTAGWYDREAISSSPGSVAPGSATASNDEQVGWALNSDWQEAISPIEIDPAENSFVRFRFALSAQAGTKTTNGFGFDRFQIYERNQVVLLEVFSSTWSRESLIVNDSIDTRPQYSGNDLIKINYFTDLANSGTDLDLINQRNTTVPGAKVAFYGVGEVPSLVIAGDANLVDINSNPYSLLSAKLANARLDNPAFDIALNASTDARGYLIVDADFTAIKTLLTGGDQFALFVAVVEPQVILSESMGLYLAGDTIRNVMRNLLPSAAGQFESGPVVLGEVRSLETVTWPINNLSDPSKVRVIAYAQDLNTKQIYQAASIDIATGLSDNVLGVEELPDFRVYPNPTDREVTVEFGGGIAEDTEWIIFDQTGRAVLRGEISKGTETMTVQTSEISSGMYFMYLYAEDRKRRAKRIMVVH